MLVYAGEAYRKGIEAGKAEYVRRRNMPPINPYEGDLAYCWYEGYTEGMQLDTYDDAMADLALVHREEARTQSK